MKSLKAFCTILLLLLLISLVNTAFSQTTYTIQRGDTLYAISRRFGVSVQAIAAANNIVNPSLIYAGQTLVIHAGESSGGGDNVPAPPPPPAPAPPPPTGGTTYVVKRGDTLFRIAVSHGVTIAAMAQANGIANPNLIYPGQVLTIPGSGQVPAPPPPAPTSPPVPPPPAPPPAPTAVPQPPPGPTGPNLLPNSSFENGYYHQNGVAELQVPNGWFFEYDSGSPYVRPESRALPSWLLPASERSLFIWDGDWTVKVFKGGVPISYRIFTDVLLQPGTYRFTANYFPDLVSGYNNGGKIWASQPAAGEVAFIKNGIGGWSSVAVGSKNTMVQEFTVSSAGNVRIGVAFRTRYHIQNNGYFMDNWTLQRLSG